MSELPQGGLPVLLDKQVWWTSQGLNSVSLVPHDWSSTGVLAEPWSLPSETKPWLEQDDPLPAAWTRSDRVTGLGVNPYPQLSDHQAIFIDSSLAVGDDLIHWLQQTNNATQTDLFLLNDDQSALVQIDTALARLSDLSAIHMISHGAAGAIQLV